MSLDWDDTTILSGGKDGTIKLQDMHSGRLLGRLGRDAACVWKVSFLGNGKVALLVSREGPAMLEIWDVGWGYISISSFVSYEWSNSFQINNNSFYFNSTWRQLP
jgi:WD40 repeat protein